MYTYDEAKEATLKYFNGDELATSVFLDKYALRDNEDNILEKTPDDMHRRMAKEIARIEKNKFKEPLTEDEIYGYFEGFRRIVPQGSIMYGLGNFYKYVSLSNCYVVDICDSYAGICRADEELVHIAVRRGGSGLDISPLRPKDTPTKNAAKTSTGIIPFMERFSNTIREVCMQGRRGALLESINVHHPEIISFINAKKDNTKVTGANISVRLTNEFLNAVDKDEEYEQRWPVDSKNPIISNKVKAKDIWKEIVKSAHNSAEPGLMFISNIEQNSPADCYEKFGFKTTSSNPCNELPLCPYDSCRLILLNLYSYIKTPFKDTAKFDYDLFFNDVQIAQRIIDDVVDLELECIDRILSKIDSDPEDDSTKYRVKSLWNKIKEKCQYGRRTGTGITGLGDCLAALNIEYGSEKSIDVVDNIYKTLKFGAYKSSIDMAKEIGSFPIFDKELEKDNIYFDRIKKEELYLSTHTIYGYQLISDMEIYGRRNIACLTTSPAGSVSLLTQTTSGIEPVFQLKYTRRKKIVGRGNADFVDKVGDKWKHYEVLHPKLQEWMNITGETDIDKSPFITADKIDWKNRVRLQSKATSHTDHSISSTINLPNSATEQDVEEIYLEAWKSGCKGITVYRDGCRDGVLVKTESTTDKSVRPRELECDVHHIVVNKQEYFALVGLWDDGTPYEMFAGKNGCINKKVSKGRIIRKKKDFYKFVSDDGDYELAPITGVMSDTEETISRLTSGLLRCGADSNFIVSQLEKVGKDKTDEMHNFGKCLARCLRKFYIPDGTVYNEEMCPTCDGILIRVGGCPTCSNCGYSKCS